jgi:lysozyme
MNQNVAAFLAMLIWSESTNYNAETKETLDPYRTCFHYDHVIQDLSDHPWFTGEWKGRLLPDKECINAGLSPGCKSTAAGAFQITHGTWASIGKIALKLNDFSEESQDACCVEILRRCRAYDLIVGGQIGSAIVAARGTWASLPGNAAAQTQRLSADLIRQYTANGGGFA